MARGCNVSGFVGALLATFAAVGVGTALAGPSDTPDGQIAQVETRPGVVQFIFSAGNLPSGARLDPKSVLVSVEGTSLDATASVADASVDPRATPVREVILVLDLSGSMQGDGIQAARQAALSYAAGLPKDVRVGLITFNDRARSVLAPTTSRGTLAAAVRGVKAAGGTALYDGIVAAADATKNLPATADRRLLILSDGDDTSSKHKLSDATAALRRDGVSADVVAFRLPGNQGALNTIAEGSQGQVLPASNAQNLAKAFSTAAAAFRQQVLVTVKVPRSLADKPAPVSVTMNAGSASVSAVKVITMPPASGTEVSTTPLQTTGAQASSSKAQLWTIVGISFAGFLLVALVAVFLPAMNAERDRKATRIAEVQRYGLIGAIGTQASLAPVTPSDPNSAITRRTLDLVDRTVRARGQRERLLSEVERAGLRMRPEEWAVLQAAAVVVGAALLAVLFGSIIGLLFGGILGFLCCRYFLSVKITRRAGKFEEQLPDTLQLLAGSLRSGFSLSQALAGVVREGTEPTAGEFARALTEVRIGADLEDALDNVAERMKCADLTLVIMAMRISRDVGGNLAEVLQNTVGTMRDRAQLRGTVRVLTAEGRISAKVLIGLPFLLGGFLLLFKRGYLNPLVTTGTGLVLLIVGAFLLLVGSFWLNRLVKIEV